MSKKLKGKGKRSVTDTNGVNITDVKRSKATCEFKISEYLLQPEVQNTLKDAWLSNENHDFEINKSITLIKDPFNCLIVKNIINNDSSIEALVDDLQNLKFVSKNNDLYKKYLILGPINYITVIEHNLSLR